MKNIFILTENKTLINNITKATEKFPEIFVSGNGSNNDESKQNCSFDQPEFIITDDIKLKDAKEYLNLCPSCHIVIYSDDNNRASNIVNTIQQEGNYRISALDVNSTDVNELLNFISTYESSFDTFEVSENDLASAFSDSPKDDAQSEEATPQFEASEENKSKDEKKQEQENFEKTVESMTAEPKDEKEVLTNILNQEPTIENDSQIEVDSRLQNYNINVNNVRAKVITIFSEKGGSGKTTIAKEMANVYSSVKLPKKLQNGNEYLKTCVVDFDFERGNLKTYLGFDNCFPNIYYWINDILDRLENKTPLDKIFYNQFQVMSFMKKIDGTNSLYALITAQGSIPQRTQYRLDLLDQEGDLFNKILTLIINSIKRAFDVIIIDGGNQYNEIVRVAFNMSDNIIYPINPTIADVEGLKVMTDILQMEKDNDVNKIAVVVNRFSKKIALNNDILPILSLIKYKDIDYATGTEVEKNYPVVSDIPNDESITNITNSFLFITNNGMPATKKGYLKICEHCLPIFKVKHSETNLVEIQKMQAKLKKKKAKLASKMNKDSENGENQEEKTSPKIKKRRLSRKEKAIKDLKGKPIENIEANAQEKDEISSNDISSAIKALEGNSESEIKENETVNDDVKADEVNREENQENNQEDSEEAKASANDYLNSDLSNVSIEEFIEKLKTFEIINKTRTGYPILKIKPKTISKKVWKQYEKNLAKEAKASLKLKRQD